MLISRRRKQLRPSAPFVPVLISIVDSSRSRVSVVAKRLLLLQCLVWPTVSIGHEKSHLAAAYPEAASKKGLQVELLDDALALGIKHAALNVNLSQLVAPNADVDAAHLPWTSDGQTFHFHRDRVERLDRTIKTLSESWRGGPPDHPGV